MTYLTYIVAGLVMISVVVVIHEFGHFIVARFFGIGTPVFSVGMGPRLFGFKWKDTDFRVSALPIGGYVQMSGADPFGEEDAASWVPPEQDFMKKPVWQRFLVMLAGPAMNIALPFVLFTTVLMLGDTLRDNRVSRVIPDSPAAVAGLQSGDRIVAVDGQDVEVWDDLYTVLVSENTTALPITVERSGARKDLSFPPGAVAIGPDGLVELTRIGISHYRHSARIGVADRQSPAWIGGLRVGDVIASVDGAEVKGFDDALEALGAGGTHALDVKRADDAGVVSSVELSVTGNGSSWGIEPLELYIGEVEKDSPAHVAGLEANDRIVAVDGEVVSAWTHLIDAVGNTVVGLSEGEEPRALVLEIVRDGQPKQLTFAPAMTRQLIRGEPVFRPVMGVRRYPDAFVSGETVVVRFGFVEAFSRSGDETWRLVKGMGRMLGHLFTARVKVTEGLGGPVAIVQAAGLAAEAGAMEFAKMMGRISLGIGILNLLPVPVLDGGQILFYLLEAMRGRPLPLVLRERILMVGVLLVAALLLVVTVSDVGRVLGS